MEKLRFTFISIILIFLVDGSSGYAQDQNNTDGFERLYRSAIANSIYPDNTKISRNLTAINKKNPRLVWKTINNEEYILVVSWKADTTYYNKTGSNNSGSREIWVTIVPELKKVCTREGDKELRLRQRLGLPPDADYKYFVEIWVKPSDLYRPCPDKEITDTECQLCFPANTDSSYIKWFNFNRIDKYYQCNLYNTYPWTQLGYTYDWNPVNSSHIGLSEFVIGKNKNFMINGFYKTADYCSKKKQ